MCVVDELVELHDSPLCCVIDIVVLLLYYFYCCCWYHADTGLVLDLWLLTFVVIKKVPLNPWLFSILEHLIPFFFSWGSLCWYIFYNDHIVVIEFEFCLASYMHFYKAFLNWTLHWYECPTWTHYLRVVCKPHSLPIIIS